MGGAIKIASDQPRELPCTVFPLIQSPPFLSKWFLLFFYSLFVFCHSPSTHDWKTNQRTTTAVSYPERFLVPFLHRCFASGSFFETAKKAKFFSQPSLSGPKQMSSRLKRLRLVEAASCMLCHARIWLWLTRSSIFTQECRHTHSFASSSARLVHFSFSSLSTYTRREEKNPAEFLDLSLWDFRLREIHRYRCCRIRHTCKNMLVSSRPRVFRIQSESSIWFLSPLTFLLRSRTFTCSGW